MGVKRNRERALNTSRETEMNRAGERKKEREKDSTYERR